MKSKFFPFLFLGVILNLSLQVYFHRDDYLTKYNPEYWHNRYLKSQWVTPNSKEPIGDDGLYAYAGWEYIHGKDPSLLNPEMPPLGKYIIGVTIVLFGNQNIQAVIFGVATLVLLYYLARLFLNKTLSMLTIYLLTLEPIFNGQISVSLLDLQGLTFLLASLFFFLRFRKSKRTPLLFFSLAFLGMIMSVKFFIVALLLGAAYLATLLLLKGKRAALTFLILTPTSFIVYFLSYTGYFLSGHNFREFLGLQKWVLVFHKSSLAFAFPGGPFWMMLFNRWESWFGGLWYRDHIIISSPDWQVTWPVLIILTIAALIKLLRSVDWKKNYLHQARLVLAVWVFVYFIFLSLIPIYPRYLLLTIPIMYILSLDLLFNQGFLKTIFSFAEKEFKKYKKDYLYFAILISLFLLWKIPPISSGNFVFSPRFAQDLLLTKNVIFGLTPLTEPAPLETLKVAILSLPYFLADGKPQILAIFLVLLPIGATLFFYYLLRQRRREFALFLIFPIIFFFPIFYQFTWEIPMLVPKEKREWLFKNEKEVLDFVYRDSKIYKFAVLPFSRGLIPSHYQFLYGWYETRLWRGKNLPVGDNKMQILYVIVEPSYKVGEDERSMIASTYKVKFLFGQKFSSGVIVWKFNRLDDVLDGEELKNT